MQRETIHCSTCEPTDTLNGPKVRPATRISKRTDSGPAYCAPTFIRTRNVPPVGKMTGPWR